VQHEGAGAGAGERTTPESAVASRREGPDTQRAATRLDDRGGTGKSKMGLQLDGEPPESMIGLNQKDLYRR